MSSYISDKIVDLRGVKMFSNQCRLLSQKIVFTNGCFDVLHYGHFRLIEQAASFGNTIIVGLNADSSVKKLKGNNRPINGESERAYGLASLHHVSKVVIFEEETPISLIENISPDVLVKGGDYHIEQIVGAKYVMSYGGVVEIVPLEQGFSSSLIIDKFNTI